MCSGALKLLFFHFFFEGLPHHYKKRGRGQNPAQEARRRRCIQVIHRVLLYTRPIFTTASSRKETPPLLPRYDPVLQMRMLRALLGPTRLPVRAAHGITSFCSAFFSVLFSHAEQGRPHSLCRSRCMTLGSGPDSEAIRP